MSRLSSKRSKFSDIYASLLPGEKPTTLILDMLIFTRMTASTPYVIEKGVSPVDLLGVVWEAHKTLGNSSTQFPFAPSRLFFKPLTIVLFVASVCPLLWVYAGDEYLLMSTHGMPYYQTAVRCSKPVSEVPQTL